MLGVLRFLREAKCGHIVQGRGRSGAIYCRGCGVLMELPVPPEGRRWVSVCNANPQDRPWWDERGIVWHLVPRAGTQVWTQTGRNTHLVVILRPLEIGDARY